MVGDAGKLLKDAGAKPGDMIGAGVTQAARMVKEIDFPQFVASLIEGTFHAIVKSSIEQMQAYAEMVKSVSTSLNDFKDRNTTDNQAMDHLVSRYPQLLQITVVDKPAPAAAARGRGHGLAAGLPEGPGPVREGGATWTRRRSTRSCSPRRARIWPARASSCWPPSS